MKHPVNAILAMRDAGSTLLEAKTAYETLSQECRPQIHLPGVSDLPVPKACLARYGITASEIQHALS